MRSLKALLGYRAFSATTLATATELAQAFGQTYVMSESIARAVKRLKEHGLVESHRGKGGGYWLTQRGQEVAAEIAQVSREKRSKS